jgi:hypothetical protein
MQEGKERGKRQLNITDCNLAHKERLEWKLPTITTLLKCPTVTTAQITIMQYLSQKML